MDVDIARRSLLAGILGPKASYRPLIKFCTYTSMANCLHAFLRHFVYVHLTRFTSCIACCVKYASPEHKEVVEITTARPNVENPSTAIEFEE